MLNSQAEREALVNLMLLVRFSDKKLSIAEMETFEKIVSQMDWTDVMSETSYINGATVSVRDAMQSQASMTGFVEHNCAVFADDVKALVLKKLTSVIMSDGAVDVEEALLAQITRALKA